MRTAKPVLGILVLKELGASRLPYVISIRAFFTKLGLGHLVLYLSRFCTLTASN